MAFNEHETLNFNRLDQLQPPRELLWSSGMLAVGQIIVRDIKEHLIFGSLIMLQSAFAIPTLVVTHARNTEYLGCDGNVYHAQTMTYVQLATWLTNMT